MWWFCYKTTLHSFLDLLKGGVCAPRICRIDQNGQPNALTIDPKRVSRSNSRISCMLQVSFVVVSYFDNKPISILYTTFSPIDHVGVTFTIRWHLINSLDILTSPMLVHYHDHMCARLRSMIKFMLITLIVCKLKCSFLDITLFFLHCYGLRCVLYQIVI
jgi:hypothetical protein